MQNTTQTMQTKAKPYEMQEPELCTVAEPMPEYQAGPSWEERQILDQRWEKYKSGKAIFHSMEDVKRSFGLL